MNEALREKLESLSTLTGKIVDQLRVMQEAHNRLVEMVNALAKIDGLEWSNDLNTFVDKEKLDALRATPRATKVSAEPAK